AGLELDFLHVSQGDYAGPSLRDPADTRRRLPLIREAIGERIPLMGVGGVETPEQAMLPLRDGAGLVALGRVALYEPEWPRLVREGRADEIRRCLPAEGGAESATIPPPLYRRLVDRPGWVRVCDEHGVKI
ncbi:MAG TPA: hypothetical protein VGE07_20290, partial [Herpetosiphonaceae bacterium]